MKFPEFNMRVLKNTILLFTLLHLNSNCIRENGRPDISSENRTAVADSIVSLADSLIKIDDFASAKVLFEENSTDLRLAQDIEQYVYLQAKYANRLQTKYLFKESLDILEEAILLGEQHLVAEQDTFLARAYHDKGVGLYYLHHFEDAIAIFYKAVTVWRYHYPADHSHLADEYFLIASCHLYNQENETAISLYKKLLKEHPSLSLYTEKQVLKNIGIAYKNIGETELSENYLNILLTKYDRNKIGDLREKALTYSLLSGLAIERKDFDLAIQQVETGKSIYDGFEVLTHFDSLLLANFFAYRGIVFRETQVYDRSLDNFVIAKDLYDKMQTTSELPQASLYSNMAMVFMKQGRSKLATDYQRRALAIYLEKNHRSNMAGAYHNLGQIKAEAGDLLQALRFQQKALQIEIPGFMSEDLYDMPALAEMDGRKIELIDYLGFKARAFRKKYQRDKEIKDLEAAFNHYSRCLEMIQKNQKFLMFDHSKINLISKHHEYFEEAVEVCFDLNRLDEDPKYLEHAFNIADRSKSVALVESKLRTRRPESEVLRTKISEREESLRASIAKIEREIYNEEQGGVINREQMTKIRNELVKLYVEYDTLVQGRLKADPNVMNFYQLPGFDVPKLQQQLDENQTLLSFFEGKDRIFVFALKNGDLNTHELILDETFDDQIKTHYENIKQRPKQNLTYAEKNQLLKSGFELYNNLLGPLTHLLTERLLIVPDGRLSTIPFETLINKSGEFLSENSFEWEKVPFLLKEYAISYHYSAIMFSELNARPQNKEDSKTVLAFAPEFTGLDVNEVAIRAAGDDLSPLFFNKAEVKAIRKIYRTKTFTGQSATKLNFVKQAKNYNLIHLASHAIVNNEAPNYSFIAFNQNSDTLDLENVLYAKEILHLPTSAELVVLSACQTADGKLFKGEGVMSLGRAFMYSGARSLVTTLWEINDAQTAQFMERFYAFLKDGFSKDVALQKAKLSFMASQNTHPYFWAAFIQIGNSRRIE